MPQQRAVGKVDRMTMATTRPTSTARPTSTTRPTSTSRPASGPRPDARIVRMPLSTPTRRLILLVHIASAGTWLGLDLVLGILVLTAFTGDPAGAGAAAASLATVATWPILIAGLVTLASGVLLGLGTRYGLVRYWWVLVKLAINVVLLTLVLLLLWPGVAAVSDVGRAAIGDGTAPTMPATIVFPPIVSSTVVIVAMTLSVFKPWGRVRRMPRDGSAAASATQPR
jgi:hypothetical protein